MTDLILFTIGCLMGLALGITGTIAVQSALHSWKRDRNKAPE